MHKLDLKMIAKLQIKVILFVNNKNKNENDIINLKLKICDIQVIFIAKIYNKKAIVKI